MPVHSIHVLKAGTGSTSIFVRIRDAGSGAGKTGLRGDEPGATAAYVREGEAPVRIDLRPAHPGPYGEGAFAEIDAELMPGLYQLGLPDAALAPGSTRATVMVRVPGGESDPVELDLVAYDPQDPKCIGMGQLGDEMRTKFLRGALPRMSELDSALEEA